MYEVIDGYALTLEQSQELFQLCLQEATYFTMTVYPRCESDWELVTFDRELEKRLEPHCIGKKHIKEKGGRWGNNGVDPLNDQDPGIKLKVFKVTPETSSILLSFYDTIYLERGEVVQAWYNHIGDEADIDYQLATLSDIFFLDDDRKVMVETLPVEGTVGIYEDNEVLLDFVRRTPGIWHHWNADDDIKDGFRNLVEWEAI